LFVCLLVISLLFVPNLAKPQVKLNNIRIIPPKELSASLPCSICVNFFDDTLNDLLNIILNVVIGGGCGELCGYLNTTLEQGVCEIICAFVGFEEFVNILENDDLDPVYLCSAMDFCPMNTCNGTLNTCTKVAYTDVTPSSGPLRTTFVITTKIIALKTNRNWSYFGFDHSSWSTKWNIRF